MTRTTRTKETPMDRPMDLTEPAARAAIYDAAAAARPVDPEVAPRLTSARRRRATEAAETDAPAVRYCQRAGCIRDAAAVVEIHDRIDGTILRRDLCAPDRNALVALFGRRFV